uniref:Coronin n=1 Tax=Astatotilapia calliptera TaxID=8154 RepID=A0AAX7UQK6_ASTCA
MSRTLIPLFDEDTGLLLLAGMGNTGIDCFEVSSSEPFLSQVSHCLTDTSTKGVALVPKLALDVMSCEVVRVLQLTDSCILPISYQVPRKNSGHEFHDDLYPDTVGTTPAMSAEEWWKGGNKQVERISLHPDKRPKQKAAPAKQTPAKKEVASGGSKEDQARDCSTSSSPLSTPSSSAAPSRSPSSTSGLSSGFVPSPSPSQTAKAFQNLMGPTSKFRHIQGTVMHRDTHITNIRGLNLTTPGECDGFCVNRQRVAVPLAISGGQIAVFERSQPGKLPDTALPTIQNSVNVADFAWDPFDTHRLAVAGDDAKIRVWQVPEGGLKETLTEPKIIMQGHTEKIYSITFHPLASGLLVSSSYDLTVRLWNLETGKQVKVLDGHQDQVFGMAWSPDGKLLATVCKDGKVRIYDPRKSTSPVQEGPGPEGHRGARVVWVCDGKYLLVSGFDSRSERGLYLYSASSLSSGAVSSVPVNVSPSTLIPYYDPDTSVVILTGKGDTRVYIYEIVPEDPYFIECSSFNSPEPHKGLAFLPKTECNVRDVEVAVGLMLTKTTIEPVAFKVPRVKKEFFQDDVYSDTAVWWEPALTGSAWLSGSNDQHKKISLKPKDMTPVSEAPKEAPVRKYLPSSVYLEEKTDEQKKDELLNAMVAKLGNMDDPLPQESYEGVDEDEWDD